MGKKSDKSELSSWCVCKNSYCKGVASISQMWLPSTLKEAVWNLRLQKPPAHVASHSKLLCPPLPPCWANISPFCMCYGVKGSGGMAESCTSLRRFLGNLFLGSDFGGVRGFHEEISSGIFGCCILYTSFGDLQCITIPETESPQ